MTAPRSLVPAVTGRTDVEGRLIEADPRLDALNARAGGALGQPLAVPQIAAIARLAARLGVTVTRKVLAADGDQDVEFLLRAEPQGGGARLTITGWQPNGPWREGRDAQRERDLTTSAADWVFELDAGLRITLLPLEAGRRHGFDAAALLGQPVTQLFALSGDEAGELPILDALARQERFDRQRAVLRGSGQVVRIAATPRLDGGGRFAGFVGWVAVEAATDATTSSNTAATPAPHAPLAIATGFGEGLERALRAPLDRIIANADSIHAQSEGPLNPDYVGYAEDIASAGRHLLGLVDDLLDLQAIERPDFTVAAEPVDLADVARRAAGLLALRAQQHDVRLDRPAPDDTMPAIGEFRRALQILVNLIGNAIRHSPPGGMIWLRIERDGGHAAVIVADQGRGIAPADQDRIFGKFERVQGEPGGSGLGLYISRRLARAMGGDVTVDSAPGQGARFIFTLPAG